MNKVTMRDGYSFVVDNALVVQTNTRVLLLYNCSASWMIARAFKSPKLNTFVRAYICASIMYDCRSYTIYSDTRIMCQVYYYHYYYFYIITRIIIKRGNY